jgi:hypothetical protein
MEILLKRTYACPTYTIGHIYINGKYFCDTIEDKDRGLDQSMSVDEIKSKKVYKETAIPTGVYDVAMNIASGTFSNFTKYPWAKPYGGKLPRLKSVKGYEGILMHPGIDQNSSAGCLIVGENKVKGKVINSQATFKRLMDGYLVPAYKKGERIRITIKRTYK